MKLVDANVLIYMVNSDSAHLGPARRWLKLALSGTEPVGMPWIAVLAFIRVTTRRGILSSDHSPPPTLWTTSTRGTRSRPSSSSIPSRIIGSCFVG